MDKRRYTKDDFPNWGNVLNMALLGGATACKIVDDINRQGYVEIDPKTPPLFVALLLERNIATPNG